MTANERKAEIIRVLVARRHETMPQLAIELDVSERTIQRDILALTADYPLETYRGNGGCVALADWYHPSKRILSKEQQTVIQQMILKADVQQERVLREILMEYGSSAFHIEKHKDSSRLSVKR